ncbi:phosphotransferase family protein [Gordonia sp. HY285]|uniref:Phosphotransferase family protein n=1 Tax=Gordonia liuliyuniae TaxID=2911517 RepID=A0ABS9ITT3_9ACTN|nr:phosphotransferase family protein [Gordonia liuliyuniae]MCF8588963.1 phosphotransferase family protein [Gordonia liuliyuniae]MCF8609156.1 phosphotransferase family protein [Gordonia liuliyuniae]
MSEPEPLDVATLTEWLDQKNVGSGPIENVTRLAGGTQNILVRFSRSGKDYVFRRPPLHKRSNSDETMRREARLLAALTGSDVPHPRLVASCDDLDVFGYVFFVMEAVDGFTATTEVPEPVAASPEMQHAMGLSIVDGAALLSHVDPALVGAEQVARADGWLDRQVGRWRRQLDSYHDLEGWPGPQLDGVDEIGRWLDENRPTAWTKGIIHGDYHFGNVMFRRDRPQVAAIVDWELGTVGDPLLDLGHLLASWPNPDESRTVGLARQLDGLPPRAELIARYGQVSGRDMTDFDWYQVLACYRLGIILEGTHARACAGKADLELGRHFHGVSQSLLDQALRLTHAPHQTR